MGVGTDLWLTLAVLATSLGYVIYLTGLVRHLVQPNRASWLIWSAATAVEAATYSAVNPHAPQRWIFFLAVAACGTIALALWRRSRWEAPGADEGLCMAACLAAILLWLIFHQAFWAHMLVVAVVPVSFWPTWQGIRRDPRRERTPAWGLWALGDIATLIVAARTGQASVGELGYIVVELACHASVWMMVGVATILPWRSFAISDGRLRVLDDEPPAAHLFNVRETHLGKAVFSTRGFAAGQSVVRFAGRRVSAAKLPARLVGRLDRFVQVSPDQYIGPSGSIDDWINHSCAPNAGLRFSHDGVFLIAIRDIAPDEEIAWDYSTTLGDPSWQMLCACGAPDCRGTIGAFDTLPPDRQEWYRARNLVAPYLRRRDRVWKKERAA